jgi:hypothetical protein
MQSLHWRGWSPDTPCAEYTKFQQIAEELVANIKETASVAEYEQAQKSLLFLYQELKDAVDPLHFRTPGGHRCLKEAYLHYAMLLRNRALFNKPLPSSPPRRRPPRSADEVVNDITSLADEVKRPGDTFLGEER